MTEQPKGYALDYLEIARLRARLQEVTAERDEAYRQHTAAGKQHVAMQESLREAVKRAEKERDDLRRGTAFYWRRRAEHCEAKVEQLKQMIWDADGV